MSKVSWAVDAVKREPSRYRIGIDENTASLFVEEIKDGVICTILTVDSDSTKKIAQKIIALRGI